MPITTEITVKTQAFAAAVAWASKWVATKPVVPVQAGLALELAADGKLSITAYGENVTARSVVAADYPGTEALQRAIVSGRLLAQLAPLLGNSKPVVISGSSDAIIIRSGSFRATLPALNENDWPTLPDAAPHVGTVAGAALADGVGRVCIACHDDPSSGMMLACGYLHFGRDGIDVRGASSPRAAGITLPWTAADGFDGGGATILGPVLTEAAAAFDGPDDVRVGLSPSLLSLTAPSRSMTVRVIALDKPYPAGDLANYFAFQQDQHVTVEPSDLAIPMKRAAIVRGKEGPVRITVADGGLSVGAAEGQIGQESDDVIEVDYSGPEHVFGVNPDYLAAALHSAPAGPVTLGFGAAKRPITLTSEKDPTWHHILMPVRI
jgi:DNA polymerase III subunit beta